MRIDCDAEESGPAGLKRGGGKYTVFYGDRPSLEWTAGALSLDKSDTGYRGHGFMKTILMLMLLGLSGAASATTYYVSASTGNDANAGTSAVAAWQTVSKVNAAVLQAGDSVLFRR